MLGAKYYRFYNDILKTASTTNQIIERYTEYIFNCYEQFHCGFGAIIENGSYKVVYCAENVFDKQLSYELLTHDIQQDMYSLEPVTITAEDFYIAFAFLKPTSFNCLTTTINSKHVDLKQLVSLQIFHEGYLVAQMVFASEDIILFNTEEIEALSFIRNNIESLVFPILHHTTDHSVDLILNTAESILSSPHYQTADSGVFMTRLLNLIFETLDEPDYGSALYYDDGFWTYAHAIGHNLKLLKEIQLPADLFENNLSKWKNKQEIAPNIFIINHILDSNTHPVVESNSLFKTVQTASKPIKQTLQLHIYVNDTLKGVISLDISTDNSARFTKKSVNLLRKIHFVGQVLFTYSAMISKTESFEHLTELISKLIVSSEHARRDFLSDFLKLLVGSLYEADYATAYIRDDKSIDFLAAVGHDLKGLQSLHLNPEHFVGAQTIIEHNILVNEKSHSNLIATLFSDIQKYAANNMPEELYDKYMIASKPIKDGLISQMKLSENVYMYISCDIKKGSSLSFSKDSIHLFSVLNNLGFSFISNEYFIDKYKNLNRELEEIITSRTKALKESNRQLTDLANRDSLTGLFNHKTIIKKLNDLTQTPGIHSILLFDIDHFKRVNDTYGHQVGDEVLLSLSHLLNGELNITAGRYGGEEFLVIFPNTDLPDAITYSHSILSKIKSISFKEDFHITVSGGVIASENSSGSDMIRKADTLLYEAKEAGRDQIKYNYC